MTAISTAVGLGRVSAITGYEIKGSLAGIKAGNLPQRIAILAEANTANQSGLPTKLSFTSAKEVGDIFGYGSPAYLMARILRPLSGDLLGGIPTIVYPLAEAGGAVAAVRTVTITGTASKTVTHKIKISGRDQLDGDVYAFVVEKGDAAAEITPKILDAVNKVLGTPAIVTNVTDTAVFTAKWKGVTSDGLKIEIDTNGDTAGLTYAVVETTPGAGVPSVSTALAAFGDEWNTIVVNSVNDSTVLDALEAFNGNPTDKTGRYEPTVFKPFVALFGDNSVDTLAEATAITDARKNEVTNVLCPAPNSDGFDFEAPANIAFLYAKLAQDTPQTDPIYRLYPDMPAAEDIGDYSDPSKRDQIVKVGSSTVKVNASQYQIVDLATTSHPDAEPQTAVLFRWVRDIVGIDWNIRYRYLLLEQIYVIGKTIVENGKLVGAANTISPDRWKGILATQLAPQLENDALIADAQFMIDSIQVQIGGSNPTRFETTFKIQRTGTARVTSTTNEALFNFGG